MTESSDSESEYEIIWPGEEGTQEILNNSEFYCKFMPSTDLVSKAVLYFCGSFPIRMAPLIAASLVQRFTDARFNWATKTLQSFLEVVCCASVMYATFSLYGDVLLALEVGTFVGAVMSVCDEVVLHFIRGIARVIRNQPEGEYILNRIGFDVPKDGKAPSDGREIALIKTLVFGYLGVVAVLSLWESFHDIKLFAFLTTCTGVAFVVTAELFSLWLPSRYVGLMLQSWITKIGQNWPEHRMWSLAEILCSTLLISCVYYNPIVFWWSFSIIGVSLTLGLNHLTDVDFDTSRTESGHSFWEGRAMDDPFLALACRLVKVQSALKSLGCTIEAKAMDMYENFGE